MGRMRKEDKGQFKWPKATDVIKRLVAEEEKKLEEYYKKNPTIKRKKRYID